LLLAFFLLYNPYVIARGSGSGLNVEHPASHRATIGFSELEGYSSLGSQDTHVFVDLFFAKSLSFLPDIALLSLLSLASELPPPQRIFCASLWVRPPPAL
jgi:hypothetical protein